MVAIFAVISFFLSGWRIAVFTVIGLLLVISLGLWDLTMTTLVAHPRRHDRLPGDRDTDRDNRGQVAPPRGDLLPVLDLMQTMPAFVYLVPFVFLLGLGAGPALLATVIFATPPAVRLTMLGIQQVPKETVEAAHAFGSTPMQTLFKVELPLSLSSIRAGVNQVIMLSLSMVVIAGLVGFEGLGKPVVEGLQQLNVGLAFEGGIGIVVLAIILDRVTRGIGGGRRAKKA